MRGKYGKCEKKADPPLEFQKWFGSQPGGGGIKAKQVCWLKLPGVRMCLPFEDGILRLLLLLGGGGA